MEEGSFVNIYVEGKSPNHIEGKYGAKVLCWIFGFGCLLAWNSMLTIEDYYYQLFPEYHPSRVLSLVYQPLALASIALLASKESKINTRWRNIAGFLLFFISTSLLIVLDLATSGSGGVVPFICVCVIVATFGLADALVQGGIVGDLCFMSPTFLQSFFAGLAASGAMTSALRLLTKAAFKNSNDGLRKGTLLFLAISSLWEFLCLLLYVYFFPKLPIIKFYRSRAALEGSKTVAADLAAAGVQVRDDVQRFERLTNMQLLAQNVDYALDLFLIYVLTLSIIPGFLYENTGQHKLGSWYALVLIAMYNVWDLISRYIPVVRCLKLESRRWLMIAVLSRFFLVPAFYFTAKYGDQGWMITLTSFLGLTNGYLTICVLTMAPKGYKGPEQNALGNLLILCLISGVVVGVALDWLWMIGKPSAF